MRYLYELLKARNFTIASCESLTGGLFAAELTKVPHVSNVLKGGIVSYWNEIKINVVGVKKETVDNYGVVSSQTAYEMAKNVQEKFKVNVAVSFTGNAGPAVLENKPAGLIYTCIIVNDRVYPFEDLIVDERNAVRKKIVKLTTKRLKEILRDLNK